MTTRRSFLKTAAAFLGALPLVWLLPKAKTTVKRNIKIVDFSSQNTWVFDSEIVRQKDINIDFLKTLDCPFEITVIPPSIEVDRL